MTTISRRTLLASAGALGLSLVAPDALAHARPRARLSWTLRSIHHHGLYLEDVAVAGRTVWAVGSDVSAGYDQRVPMIVRRVGGAWHDVALPVSGTGNLTSIAVASAKSIWAAGEAGTDTGTRPLVVHWDGSAWAEKPLPVEIGSLSDVVVAPDGSVWVAGWARVDGSEPAVVYRYANGSWAPLLSGLERFVNGNCLAVISAKNAWIGLNPGLAHWNGSTWTSDATVPNDGTLIPTGFSVVSAKNIWASAVRNDSTQAPAVLH